MDKNTSEGSVPLFVLTTRLEHTVVPKSVIRKFTAVSNDRDYRAVMDDPQETSVWYINPANGLDGGGKDAFELVQFTVDGEERTIRRTSK